MAPGLRSAGWPKPKQELLPKDVKSEVIQEQTTKQSQLPTLKLRFVVTLSFRFHSRVLFHLAEGHYLQHCATLCDELAFKVPGKRLFILPDHSLAIFDGNVLYVRMTR